MPSHEIRGNIKFTSAVCSAHVRIEAEISLSSILLPPYFFASFLVARAILEQITPCIYLKPMPEVSKVL